MRDFRNVSMFEINNLTLEEITTTIDSINGDLVKLLEENPDRVRCVFARLSNLFPSYEEFCDFIKFHIKPNEKFYLFASKEMVFYKRGKVPTFFFTSTNEKYDDVLYSIDDIVVAYEDIKQNVQDMLRTINPSASQEKYDRLRGEFFKYIYASDMPYLECGTGAFILTTYDWTNPNLEFDEEDIYAVENLAILEGGYNFVYPFYKYLNDEVDMVLQPSKKFPIIANNISKLIGDNEKLLTKFILGLLSSEIEEKRELIKKLINNYNKVSKTPYTLISVDTKKTNDELYTAIIDHYIDKLLDGSLERLEKETIIMDLINSEYDPEELEQHMPRIESIILNNKDPFILLFYQSLIIKEYIKNNNLNQTEFFYSPVIVEEGAYNEDFEEVRLYLMDDEYLCDSGVVFDAITTAYHEARHIYQYQHQMYDISFPAFLNSIDRELTDKSFKEENNKDYKTRYEDVYYERDARIHAYHDTIKKLCQINKGALKEYLKKNRPPMTQEENDIELVREGESLAFVNDCKLQRDVERFNFLVSELYNRFSLPEISELRKKYPTFEIAFNEDGTPRTIEELLIEFNNIEYEGTTPTSKSLHKRGFIYNLIKSYRMSNFGYEDNLEGNTRK